MSNAGRGNSNRTDGAKGRARDCGRVREFARVCVWLMRRIILA